jgi:aminoglycoside phosphotransferase (APT) family kinase protein
MSEEHRALVERLFPQLGVRTFEPIGDGWTYDTYEVNGEWIVQIPRTRHAEERLRAQRSLLPELVLEVSSAIPLPDLASDDPPAVVYRKLEGVPCAEAPDGIWPERLGRFLYDLHSVPPEFLELRRLPADDVREDTRAGIAALSERVHPLLDPNVRSAAERILGTFLDTDEYWRFATVLTHGDLGPAHGLCTPTGDLAGVLDWEEAAIGDPVVDFAWWLHAMPQAGERALAAYGGPPDATFRDRAQALFVLMPYHEVAYGLKGAGDAFVESGLQGVRERLADVVSTGP